VNFYIFFLLVILSAYSEYLQYSKPSDSFDLTAVTVCSKSSSDLLSVLTTVLPQNEVYKIVILSQNEMFGPQNVVLPLNKVSRTAPAQSEVHISVLFQNGIFKLGIVSCQLANKVKIIINFVSNLEVKISNF
jgi:hypothetical protein